MESDDSTREEDSNQKIGQQDTGNGAGANVAEPFTSLYPPLSHGCPYHHHPHHPHHHPHHYPQAHAGFLFYPGLPANVQPQHLAPTASWPPLFPPNPLTMTNYSTQVAWSAAPHAGYSSTDLFSGTAPWAMNPFGSAMPHGTIPSGMPSTSQSHTPLFNPASAQQQHGSLSRKAPVPFSKSLSDGSGAGQTTPSNGSIALGPSSTQPVVDHAHRIGTPHSLASIVSSPKMKAPYHPGHGQVNAPPKAYYGPNGPQVIYPGYEDSADSIPHYQPSSSQPVTVTDALKMKQQTTPATVFSYHGNIAGFGYGDPSFDPMEGVIHSEDQSIHYPNGQVVAGETDQVSARKVDDTIIGAGREKRVAPPIQEEILPDEVLQVLVHEKEQVESLVATFLEKVCPRCTNPLFSQDDYLATLVQIWKQKTRLDGYIECSRCRFVCCPHCHSHPTPYQDVNEVAGISVSLCCNGAQIFAYFALLWAFDHEDTLMALLYPPQTNANSPKEAVGRIVGKGASTGPPGQGGNVSTSASTKAAKQPKLPGFPIPKPPVSVTNEPFVSPYNLDFLNPESDGHYGPKDPTPSGAGMLNFKKQENLDTIKKSLASKDLKSTSKPHSISHQYYKSVAPDYFSNEEWGPPVEALEHFLNPPDIDSDEEFADLKLGHAPISALSKGVGYGGSNAFYRHSRPTATKSVPTSPDGLHQFLFKLLAHLLVSTGIMMDNSVSEHALLLMKNSAILERAAELLRNDSIEDVTSRLGLYESLLEFLQVLSPSPQFSLEAVLKHRYSRPGKSNVAMLAREILAKATPNDDAMNYRKCQPLLSLLQRLAKHATFMLGFVNSKASELLTTEPSNMRLYEKIGDLSDAFQVQVEVNLAFGEQIQANDAKVSSDASAKMKEWHRENCVIEVPDEQLVTSHSVPNYRKGESKVPGQDRMKRLMTELTTLRSSLPEGIYLRYCSGHLGKMKAIIVGPSGTPYEGGLFEFDIDCPMSYPNTPPNFNFKTTGGGTVRFNPNLYPDGKVCLSLLGTWQGESWRPGESTLLQVLISLQSMVLCDEPWYNEPGRERRKQSRESESYNEQVWYWTTNHAMLHWLNPAKTVSSYARPRHDKIGAGSSHGIWADVIKMHFTTNGDTILECVQDWANISEVREKQYGNKRKPKPPPPNPFTPSVPPSPPGLFGHHLKTSAAEGMAPVGPMLFGPGTPMLYYPNAMSTAPSSSSAPAPTIHAPKPPLPPAVQPLTQAHAQAHAHHYEAVAFERQRMRHSAKNLRAALEELEKEVGNLKCTEEQQLQQQGNEGLKREPVQKGKKVLGRI